ENLEDGDNHRIASVASNIINSLLKNNLLNDKNLLKSKVLNLKDKNNKSLCKNVYERSISAEKFVFMSIDEMKSEELKKIESNMQKNILLEMQIPQIKGETDMFQCGKCGKRECSYRQLQTRSADEPMTTFVTCVCGHRWKF
ncbi:transcription elongation factor S-II, partial [Anncaliia algerae PRA109]